jgi:hypothetical protein
VRNRAFTYRVLEGVLILLRTKHRGNSRRAGMAVTADELVNARSIGSALTILVLLEAIAYGLAALVHAGIPIPIGIREPAAGSAAVTEALIALAMLITLATILGRRSWARGAAFISHGIAVLGIMMAMANLALGRGDRSIVNDFFYRLMLLVAMLILVFLLTPAAANALGRSRKTV